jgi:hypothetical protein
VAAGRWSFTVERGSVFSNIITDKRASDYSGYDALLQIRSQPDGGALYLTMSVANGRLTPTTNGTYAQITMHISAADTASLSWRGRAYYDLLISPGVVGDANTQRLLEGRVALSPPVTVP